MFNIAEAHLSQSFDIFISFFFTSYELFEEQSLTDHSSSVDVATWFDNLLKYIIYF